MGILLRVGPDQATSSPKFLPYDKLDPGPHLGDGADLDVDKPERQSYLAECVFRDVPRYLCRLFGPRDPQDGRWPQLRATSLQELRELRLACRKDVHEIGGTREARERHPFRQGLEQLEIVGRCV